MTAVAVAVPIFWTCHTCGVVERELRVRERQAGEDVLVWMRCVQVDVSTDHAIASKRCKGYKFDLKIPMQSRDSRIGEAVKH